MEQQAHVKHIVRTIAAVSDPSRAIASGAELDDYLSRHISEGWKLFATHYLSTTPDGISMLYVLVK